MALAAVSNQLEQALALLITQFKSKVNLAAAITSYVNQIQALDNALFELINERTLTAAVGSQLDGIGAIVGESRKGRSDSDYRLGVRARIRINTSSGTPENLIGLMGFVLSVPVLITESVTAAFTMQVLSPITTAAALSAASSLKTARPAGVDGQLIYQTDVDANTFTFSSGDTEEASSTQGWADDGQTNGGKFAEVEGA